MTAKHYDDLCLFDSTLIDYKSTAAKAGRDLVYNDLNHPMRGNEAYRNEAIDFDRYLDYMHGQVRELVSGYGNGSFLSAKCHH